MYVVLNTIKVKPEHLKDFIENVRNHARNSVREPGCLRFDVFQDLAVENRYILYEVYSSEEAFRQHLATPHARRAMEASRDWAEKGFEVTRAISVCPSGERYFATPKAE